MTRRKTWTCGDCGTVYPKKVKYCYKYLDDYLAVNGYRDIEDAIHSAVYEVLDCYPNKNAWVTLIENWSDQSAEFCNDHNVYFEKDFGCPLCAEARAERERIIAQLQIHYEQMARVDANDNAPRLYPRTDAVAQAIALIKGENE